ncbi:GCN5-related N-acetyltransferase [Halothece sp. PCC 7418]|uniref:GNAT family N-acetyltransferase n=1 Tax=Halothece sp. (strain PCC 7418) TaxID=65093 RepID=UPI0002A07154|nr:GNAT family N-acetyltransferase [Halothece sp. PCC 7418]AFZ45175.1 GCN5-related N-acetyltransferase [Halothece sp. PCC 7418]
MDQTTTFQIRSAQREDVSAIMGLIEALAAYEHLSDAVTGNAETLAEHLFGETPYAEVLVAEWGEIIVGFALFFSNYSTFLTQPGIYLEDLFVLSEYRGCGVGRALISAVATIAHQRGAGRLEWSVLDWNQPAIDFYQAMGAQVLPDWRICRVTGSAIAQLATQAPPS